MDHAHPEVYLGAATERAPEVAPSDKSLLVHEGSGGLQLIEDDSQKEMVEREEHNPGSEAVANTDRPPRRRKTVIWLAVSVITTIAIAVAVSIGVHFGKQSRNASEDAQTASLSQISKTTLSTATSTALTLSSLMDTVTASGFRLSRTMAVVATPSAYIEGELGCFQQRNSQTPLCAQPDCPDGYRKVF